MAAKTHSNISTIHRMMGEYDLAVNQGVKSVEIERELKDVESIINALVNLSNTLAHLGREEERYKYLKEALEMAQKKSQDEKFSIIYDNLGTYFHKANNLDSAEYYLNESFKNAKEYDNKHVLSAHHVNIADVYIKREEYIRAEESYFKALEIQKANKFEGQYDQTLCSLADLYLSWDIPESERSKYSQKILDLRRDLIKVENQIIDRRDNALTKSYYSAMIGLSDWNNEVSVKSEFQSKLIAFQDSSLSKSKIDAANEWAEKFKTAEKEKEILTLESENKLAQLRQRGYFFGLLGTIGFGVVLGFLYQRYMKQKNKRKRMEDAEAFRTELSNNLHDEVGSMLSNLAVQSELTSLVADPDKKEELMEISEMSKNAMESLRDTVWAINASVDKYDDLIDRMLEYGRKNLSRKDIEFKLKKGNWRTGLEMEPQKRQNVYLIFKEAITNILKHSNADTVSLHVSHEGSLFNMSIQDNGKIENKMNVSGLGMRSMEGRAEKIKAKFSTNTDNGYEVKLQMPL